MNFMTYFFFCENETTKSLRSEVTHVKFFENVGTLKFFRNFFSPKFRILEVSLGIKLTDAIGVAPYWSGCPSLFENSMTYFDLEKML